MGRRPTSFAFAANREINRLTCLAVILLTILSPTEGQDCSQRTIASGFPASAPDAEWSFTKQVNEVNVLFVAFRHGKFRGDLSASDLNVRDDHKPPEAILAFRTVRELPLRAGIVIDTSGSVTPRFRFEQAAATAFLRHALNQNSDLAFLMGFSDHFTVFQDFTADPDLLSKGIERLTSGGGTALYDAVRAGCEKLQNRPERDLVGRVLVILSDGQNNAGTFGLDAAVDAAQQAGVTIYAISTRYPEGLAYSGDFAGQEGNRNLRQLAEQTGGRVLYASRPRDLSQAFAVIDEELRSRYVISYRPADFRPDGHYRTIQIEARRAGEKLQVRARKGYRAGVSHLAVETDRRPDSLP